MDKKEFNPLAQHRDWCPWIAIGKENMDPGTVPCFSDVVSYHQQGWKVALDLLMPIKNSNSVEDDPPQVGVMCGDDYYIVVFKHNLMFLLFSSGTL